MSATEIAQGANTQDKDEIVFVSKDDEDVIDAEVKTDDSGHQGAVGPDGEIDWDCPCLNGMASGPCGEEFKDAFSCFVHSEDEPKGSGCMEQFKVMHDCIEANAEYFEEKRNERDAQLAAHEAAREREESENEESEKTPDEHDGADSTKEKK